MTFRDNLAWMMGFYRPLKKRLLLIGAQSVAVALVTAVIPYIYIHIIDAIKTDLSSRLLTQAIALLFLLGSINFLLSVTNATRRAKTNLELEWRYRQETFNRLMVMDHEFYSRFRTGDLVTRLTDDVGRKLSWVACSGVFRALESSLKIVFCFTAMFLINPYLALITLIPFPLQVFIYFKSARKLHQRFDTLQKLISRVNDTIESCFSGIRIIQAYCAENRQALKFRQVAGDRAAAEVNAERYHIFVHLLYGYFWQLAQILILFAGGWMVIQNRLTVGEFVAFDYYILMMVWPMFDIGGFLVDYRRASISIARLREIESWKPKILNPENPVETGPFRGRIRFDNVSYTLNGHSLVKNLSFDTGNARTVAVVGEVGSGKSSIINLLCRFYEPDNGEIFLDEQQLNRYPLAYLREKIGYVSQEPLLFTDTIKNNIRFGRDDIPDSTVNRVADCAQLMPEIRLFPMGFDTPIGLRGMTLSGGQKQRISIARAMLGNPGLLVLDDATAHLDAKTEEDLWKVLFEQFPGTRTIFTSHRTATLEKADVILVLKNGLLVESGRHSKLMTQKGEYFRIYSRRKLQEKINGNTTSQKQQQLSQRRSITSVN
ncbi:ABC transporter ATP-binding protein [bacterium]|nr:ABC transporter ATP-binding protein [candidate division CSSED10-310 bacterium]